MRNRLVPVTILALFVLLSSLPVVAAGMGKSSGKPAAAPEEGTWKVKVVPDSEAAAKGESEFDDTLSLHKGKFKSTACLPYGFAEVAYKLEAGTVMADMTSSKEGKNHWHAEVSGDAISGKMTWTKPDGTVLNYTFSGARAGGAGVQTRKSAQLHGPGSPMISETRVP